MSNTAEACTKNQTETDAFIGSTLGSLGEYKMDKKRRGRALIFNQESFFWRLELRYRKGTNVDRDNLEKRLKELNFEVAIHNNLKQMEVLDKIGEAAEDDHSDADCFLLVFLSHGENGHVWTHDGKISIQDITSMFKGDKCSSLVGKPKIFIFQACRGDKPDDSVTACAAGVSESDNDLTMDACALYSLPAGADFLMCYSVAEGYYSFRDTSKGSWYIQDLCELLQEFGDSLEFTELLTWVNCKVSMRTVESINNSKITGKQVPCFASMLTKKLFFKPKK
ncbi:caspase-6-like [Acanthopagrus latus]|uniref:caspase-6-like n=1 Tax=Acanthopagrus latus TaxID=8177 RepID=UPI00187C007E|nr:caspase-6-like [Acanthopagrus latus]